jgi:hypothetical protein
VAKSKLYTTNYRDAQVFRDANGDGVLNEPNEILLQTDENGAFSALPGKGRFILKGGFDINTGDANPYDLLTAPNNARSIGTLTSLWQSLLNRGATTLKIAKILNLPSKFSLPKFSAVPIEDISDKTQELAARKEAQADLLTQWVSRIADTTFGARFAAQGLEGDALKAAVQAAENETIGNFAQALLDSGQKQVDLSDRDTVRALLNATLNRSGIDLSNAQLDQSAQAASEINAQYDTAPKDKLDELEEIADNSAEVFAARDFGTLVEEYTGANLDDQVRNEDIFIAAPALDFVDQDTGASPSDGTTNDNTPAFNGRVSASAIQVNVYRDGAKIDSVPASNGAWSYASPPLADGRYRFSFAGVNALGNEGDLSQPEDLTVDTAPPAVPTVTPASGTNANPTVRGTWKAGAGESLIVSVGGQAYTEGNGLTIAPNQTWSVKLVAPLAPGVYDVVARAEDIAGNARLDASLNELVVQAVASGFALSSDAPAGVPVREGGAIVFSVAPNGGALTAGATLTLSLGGAGGQATAADFNPSAQAASFAVGDANAKTLGFAIVKDGLKEGVETYLATLLDAAGNVLATLSGLIDDPPNLPPAVSGVADIAGATGVALALPNLAFSDADGDALTVTLTATGGTLGGVADADPSTPGVQLIGSPSAVTAAFAGATFAGANAGAGSVGVSVSDGVNPAVSANVGVTLTNASIFELSGPATAVEGDQVVFTVARAGDSSKAATVNFSLAPGGGASQADYGEAKVSGATVTDLSASGGTLAFPAGSAQATISLSLLADGIPETGETLTATLLANPSDPAGMIDVAKGSLSVALQDPPTTRFTLSSDAIGSVPTPEGGFIVFTVTPNEFLLSDTDLALNLVPASDFSPASQTIAFKAGETSARTVAVQVIEDNLAEGVKSYQATLLEGSVAVSAISGLTSDPRTTQFTLRSDGTAPGVPIKEGATVTFTVIPDGPVTSDTTLTLSLDGAPVGGAPELASPDDFSPAVQSIHFAAGETAPHSVSVFVVDNDGAGVVFEGYQATLLDGFSNPIALLTGLIDTI